jgi:5-oxoprolinase (ATP-hydrolysing) subunit A
MPGSFERPGVLSIDLNSDIGEGFPNDEGLMAFISSVNIACGAHAGSQDLLRRTVELALKHEVSIGAHPSYPDRENFGRIDLLQAGLELKDLPSIITDQLSLMQSICSEFHARIEHVKFHGALYNRAARDPLLSSLICQVLAGFDPSLLLYGLSGSPMKEDARRMHIPFVEEVFADRNYLEDGSLVPRIKPDSLIRDPYLAAERVLQMVKKGTVNSITGREIKIIADTVCIHGDQEKALEFAKSIRQALDQSGISVRKPLPRSNFEL